MPSHGRSRDEIHFGEAGRNVVEQIQDAFAGHVPEWRMPNTVSLVTTFARSSGAHESQPRRQERASFGSLGNADRSHSVLATHGDEIPRTVGCTCMWFAVDVIECEPGSRESLELRANLRFEIASRSRTEEKVYTRSHQIA